MKIITIIFLTILVVMNISSIAITCIFAEVKKTQWLDAYVVIAKKRFRNTDTIGYILQLFKYTIITPSMLLLLVCESIYNILFIFQNVRKGGLI